MAAFPLNKVIYGINPQETKWRPGELTRVSALVRTSDGTFEVFESSFDSCGSYHPGSGLLD